jgi:hypothetical protein
MYEDQIVKAVDNLTHALFVLLLVFPTYQDVSYAGNNHRLARAAPSVLQKRKQLEGKLLAAKRKQLGDENIRPADIEGMQQEFPADSFGFLQIPGKITELKVREIRATPQRYQLQDIDVRREAETFRNFSPGNKQDREIAGHCFCDFYAADKVPNPQYVLAIKHYSLHGSAPSGIAFIRLMLSDAESASRLQALTWCSHPCKATRVPKRKE